METRVATFTERFLLFVFQVVVDTSLESPAGLAIDWVTNKLYWTDAGKQPHFTCSDTSCFQTSTEVWTFS